MFNANSTEIILALIALLATLAGAVIWVAKYALREVSTNMKANTAASMKQVSVSKEAIKASSEILTFMKALNGKLAHATIQTVKEQKVEHQTIKVQGANK